MIVTRVEELKKWVINAIADFNSSDSLLHSRSDKTENTNERSLVEQSDEIYLVDMLFRNVNGTDYLEIYIDTDKGITIDKCARISRKLADEIELSESLQALLNNRFRLEVSSPGLTRPIKLMRQFRKNIGRKLRVKYKDALNNYQIQKGTLQAVSEQEPKEIILNIAQTKKGKTVDPELLNISLVDLVEATIEVEF